MPANRSALVFLALAALASKSGAQGIVANGSHALDASPTVGNCTGLAPALEGAPGFQHPQPIGVPPKFPLYPMAGNQNSDVWISHYKDLVPGAGKQDFACGTRTYNTHSGIDSVLRSFAEQDIGVPVYAAYAGVVSLVIDGHPDKNTVNGNFPANYVVIDHGNGYETQYWHLKKWSIIVGAGQPVKAGQQIGEVGSSGNSSWPHLHFMARENGVNKEPFSGPCNLGPSWWRKQPTKENTPVLYDFAITETSPAGIAPPFPWPRSKAWAQTNACVYLWVNVRHTPADSTIRFDFRRPDLAVAHSTGDVPFTETGWIRAQREWWGIDFPELHVTAGPWTVDIYINGDFVKNVPMEVVPTSAGGVNSPPEPVALSFWPACPQPEDVILCRVSTDLVLDDWDYDALSYRYEWKVNNVVVRDIVSAAHSDALPESSLSDGDLLSCTVTPNDGTVDGPSTTVTETVGSHWLSAYCTPGLTTNGCLAAMSGTGHASRGATAGFVVTTSNVEANKQGLLFWGLTPKSAPWGGGTSTLCVAAPVVRTPSQSSGGGIVSLCDGSFTLDFNTWMATNPWKAPEAGDTVHMQAWFRDPPAPMTTSLSDALQFPVCP